MTDLLFKWDWFFSMKFFGLQKEALEHSDGHTCFIGQEINSNTHGSTYLRGSIKTWSDFKEKVLTQWPRDKWTFNEWLRPDTPMKLFLDIDLSLKNWEEAKNDPKRPEWQDPSSDANKEAFIALWQPRFQKVLQNYFLQGAAIDENTFYWSHACREDKLSFHVTINYGNFVASDHHAARAYLDKIVEMYPDFAIYADPSVYRSNGFMRMVFNRKVLYNNALQPMFEYADESEAFEKMNIQHFDAPTKDAFQFYNIPKTKKFLKKTEKQKQQTGNPTEKTNLTMESAVAALVNETCGAEVVKEVKVIEDLIVVGLTLKFCPNVDREHSSNHQYAIINKQGLVFKCHAPNCASVEYKKRPLAGLPKIIRKHWEKNLSSTSLTNTTTPEVENQLFRHLNNTFNNGEMVEWTQAPTELYKHQNDSTLWVQPESKDCLVDTENAHMNRGVCGVVTNTSKCSVCVRCPMHGTVERPDLKPILEHVHLGLIEVKAEITKKKDTDLAALIADMFQIAEAAHLRIGVHDGMMYSPVKDKPSVFKPLLEFRDWIRENLMDDPRLLADPLRIEKLEKSLENACYSGVPILKWNNDLIGFRNGILCLSTNEFIAFGSEKAEELRHQVCRHYIDEVLDLDNLETSAFDTIFEYQFKGMTDDEDKEYDLDELRTWTLALFGRLFFDVGQRDDLEITPVIYGVAGSGKSSIGEMVQAFFPKSRIGSIGASFEAKFGLEGLLNKDVILSMETPQNIHELLDKTSFQSMTTGESISAARKNKLAITKDWKTPLIFFANQMLSFFDAGGASVARRIASIRFERALDFDNQDLTLKHKLKKTELPAALYKSVEAYNRLIANRSDVSRGFWSICPKYFRDQLNANLETTNPFLAWLKAPQSENGIIKDKHAFVLWDEIKSYIDSECPVNSKPKKMSTKTAEFSMMGWRPDRKMICGCRKIGKSNSPTCQECGEPFLKKVVIYGCRLVDEN